MDESGPASVAACNEAACPGWSAVGPAGLLQKQAVCAPADGSHAQRAAAAAKGHCHHFVGGDASAIAGAVPRQRDFAVAWSGT